MLRVEANNLPCLIVCEQEYHKEYVNIERNYSKSQEILLLDIKNNIYKIEIQDEYIIKNPRYFIQEQYFLIECNINGKIAKRHGEYCILHLHFIKEILISRLPFEFEKLLTINNDLLEKEISRLEIEEKPIYEGIKNTNLKNITLIQQYWQNIIYKRFKNDSYEYNGMSIDYFKFI